MLIARLKEGSAGLLPLSGAAPASWGWGERRRMKAIVRNKANIIIDHISPVSLTETSEVFFFIILTFLIRSLAIMESAMKCTFLSTWRTGTAHKLSAHKPYQYTSP